MKKSRKNSRKKTIKSASVGFLKKTEKVIRRVEKKSASKLKVPLALLTIVFAAIFISFLRSEIKNGWGGEESPGDFAKRMKRMELEVKIGNLVKGYPIEKMVPLISQKDEQIAALLVGIAKKESNWGRRAPVLDGEDCFNYWGYRGKSERMGTDGHTCFENPKEAVNEVSGRLSYFVNEKKFDSPNKLAVWKCGWDCRNQDPASVEKWIDDVDWYYDKIIREN